jgi:hypothetical protein
MSQAIHFRTPRVRRCGNGFAAEGPGFFVWDSDPRAVADAALLLARGAAPARKPERLLVVHAGGAGRRVDPEALDA